MRPATRPDGAPVFDLARAIALYPDIPRELLEGLGRYFNLRIQPGQFLHEVLRNDLAQAVLHAGPESIACLRRLVVLLVNDAPAFGWGSEKAVQAWLKGHERSSDIDLGRLHEELREAAWPRATDGRHAPDYFCIGAPTVDACVEAKRCPRDPVCNE